MRGSEAISPTAHYTGHIWSRNGLSHPELRTLRGRGLFASVEPTMAFSRLVGGPTLEDFLLARHLTLDALLTEAIEQDGVTQVIEVAAGLSPRGWRFAQRYGDRITYVEADLPDMAARKRDALARIGSLGDHHRVEEVDALRDEGPASLASLAARLDPRQPAAVVTEGLLGYFDREQAHGMWRRFAAVLGRFPAGRYFSDTYVAEDMRGPHIRAFRAALGLFVRGQVHVHYEDAGEAEAALADAGFAAGRLIRAEDHPAAEALNLGPGVRLVRVIDARSSINGEP